MVVRRKAVVAYRIVDDFEAPPSREELVTADKLDRTAVLACDDCGREIGGRS